jgi:hypothetical protein
MQDGLRLLDENENEQLYRLENDMFNTVILVCNGEEYCLGDWQTNDEPETLADCAYYDWHLMTEFCLKEDGEKI